MLSGELKTSVECYVTYVDYFHGDKTAKSVFALSSLPSLCKDIGLTRDEGITK